MLTFEKVLDVFKDYLDEDKRYEILMTSHGYTIMEWDSAQKDWADAQVCPTAERMKDILLDALAGYMEYKITLCSRSLADGERLTIQEQVARMDARLQ